MTPARLTLPTPARIVSVRADNYRTKTFVLDARLDAAPGRFVMAWLPRFDEKPFSLVDADPVTLMVTAVGPFSRLLHARGPGDLLWLRGPFGQGFHPRPAHRRVALVGGGYGVAPLHWLARRLMGACDAITVIIGARTADDVLYAPQFAQLESASPTGGRNGEKIEAGNTARLRTLATTEDGSLGTRGLVTDALRPLLAAGEVDAVFACGPHAMLAALERLGGEYGVPCQSSWEAYMRCAVGICGACEHAGKVLCMDGPVLESQ